MSSITLPGPIAFVFSGGAARSSAQVGMLRATLAAGLLPQLVVGSSTGALNAAATAISIDTAADVLERVWIDLATGLATQCATGTVLDAVMACAALPVIVDRPRYPLL